MQTKWFRWFLVLLTAMSLAYIAIPASAVEKRGADEKIAIVNGVVITQGDFDREMVRVYQQFAGSGKSLPESQMSDIKKKVLETLISRELLYQESQNKGIKVEDEAVNEQFISLKKQFPGEEEFKTVLSEMKISEAALKSQFRKRMAIQQFIDKQFVQKITVPDKEVKAFYDSHPDSFKEPEKVRAGHILIKVAPGADEQKKAAARKKLEELQKRLQKGEDFAALAKEFSECPSSAKGGDLGYFRRRQMVKSFEDVAFALRPGEMSDIVETTFGYHLIKVVDKKPESTIDYEKVKDRLQQYLKQQKVKEKVDIYIEKLKEKAKVERFENKTSK